MNGQAAFKVAVCAAQLPFDTVRRAVQELHIAAMLTLTLAAAVLACSAASPWNSDPWPAASQQRPATVNSDPWPAGNQRRPATSSNSVNPDDYWWNKPGSPFDDPAAHPSQSQGSQGHRAPVQRPQISSASYQSGGGAAPARAIVSVSRAAADGAPRVTGVRRVSSAAAGVTNGGVASAAVSGQYIPPAASRPQLQPQPRPQQQQQQYRPQPQPQSQPQPRPQQQQQQQQYRPQPQPQRQSQQRPQPRPQVSYASASSPSRHQTSVSSVSSGGSFSRPNSGTHFFSSASQPQPSRFNPGQFSGSNSAPAQNQYAGSVPGSLGGSTGAQSPVVKACSASLFCVDTNSCDPYTGFLMDPSQGPIPQLDQPTVAFTRCYMDKNRSVGVCCQEPHINDPWTVRPQTNGASGMGQPAKWK